MGGEQAADVLSSIKKEQLEKGGKTLSDKEMKKIRQPILDKYEEEGSAYYSTSRLWDDGIIDPCRYPANPGTLHLHVIKPTI